MRGRNNAVGLCLALLMSAATAGCSIPGSPETHGPDPAESTTFAGSLTLSPDDGSGRATTSAGASPSKPAAAETSRTGSTRPEADPGLVTVVGVSDGDTIRVRLNGEVEKVRVIGIDTPEIGECFAAQATAQMRTLLADGPVRLDADPTQAERDRYNRLLRHVRLANGTLAAQELIAGGYGREYTYDAPYAHQSAFREAQAQAQRAGRGIWGTDCPAANAGGAGEKHPTAPRQTKPEAQGAPKGKCAIKGNISRGSGEKIYHVPSGDSYQRTQISESKGERWFCSEREAVEAGWRRARD
ncbi:thermonuclease family protein [Gephyromycinifex aptenodytis]|uniref:thermonuclease family protein n=1 Tax=Gephyromycinifex aptenodytis TaxID=2716227 RepID=UPI001D004A6E|nr:thermonuclease family protein [Gephyromycinifex aptenodytis]